MKKLLLSLFAFLLLSFGQAYATTWDVCSGGSNINGTGFTSILGDVTGCTGATGTPTTNDTVNMTSNSGTLTMNVAPPTLAAFNQTGNTATLAMGTQTLTVTGLCTLQGPETNTSGTISCAGGVTLGSTPTGTFPTLTIAGSSTFTPAGFTWPGNLNLGAFTLTLAANTIVSGNFTMTGNGTVLSGAFSLSVGGNLVQGGNNTVTTSGGIPTIILNGSGTQTWTGSTAHPINCNITINSSGTVVISGGVSFATGTFTYLAGTVTTTSSTFGLNSAPTLTTDTGSAHITFNNITMEGNNTSFVLGSNLTSTGTFTGFGTVAITGAFNMTFANFNYASAANASATFTFPASQTLTVTTGMNVEGNQTATMTMKSGTSSTAFNLAYTGTASAYALYDVIMTDVNASTSTPSGGLYNYKGTDTRTTNITVTNATNFSGGGAASLFMMP